MSENKTAKDKHRNMSPNTTRKQIRWDNTLLEESQEIAKELGMSWSAFVQEAVREKTNQIKENSND